MLSTRRGGVDNKTAGRHAFIAGVHGKEQSMPRRQRINQCREDAGNNTGRQLGKQIPTRVGAQMLRPPQQMLETCEGPWVRAHVRQVIPETTGETSKSNADAASMAAGSIARSETRS
jgi:hypothetical protein